MHQISQDMSEFMYSVWFEKKIIAGSDMFIELEVSPPHLHTCLNQEYPFLIQRLSFSNELKLLIFGMKRESASWTVPCFFILNKI